MNGTNQTFNDYNRLDIALSNIGFSHESKMIIYRLCAAILHLGNIELEEDSDEKCLIPESSLVFLQRVANLLSLNENVLKNILLTRCFNINGFQET